MLELLGLGASEEAVYRTILRNPTFGVADLCEALGWSEQRVRASLNELSRLSLLRPSWEEPGVLRLVSPEVGLAALLAREEAALFSRQQQIAASRATVAQLIATYSDRHDATSNPDAEQINGLDAIRERIEELAAACTTELLGLEPQSAQTTENLEASRPLDQALLERGVAMRIIYLDSLRNDQPTRKYVTWLTELGGRVRTTPSLPLRMVLFDRKAALLPINPDDSSVGAVLLRGAGIVAALVALFEQIWLGANPLGVTQPRDERGLNPQEQEILRLLASGQTDEVVARRLDVSVRTGRRITAELMDRLGARSRFQAGYLAAVHGWLPLDV